METKNSSRKIVIGAAAGVLVAMAIGGAFVIGRAGGTDAPSAAQASGVVATTPAQATSDGAGARARSTVDGSQPEPADTDGPEDTNDSDEATATPTATPSGECAVCVDGGFAAEPTPTPQCAFCIDGGFTAEPTPTPECAFCIDGGFVQPVDTPPSIGEVTTSFCYPNLVLFFELEDADSVWFSFNVDGGGVYQTDHIDADTFQGFLSMDMSDLGWDVILIENLRVHAKDDQGNHVWSDEVEMPAPDLSC